MSKRERWFDCNGVEIHEGDKIRYIGPDSDGGEELVYACRSDDFSEPESLGLNASNEKWLETHPNCPREIYPFSNFKYSFYHGRRLLRDYEKVV